MLGLQALRENNLYNVSFLNPLPPSPAPGIHLFLLGCELGGSA